MNFFTYVSCFIVGLSTFIYFWVKERHKYWERRNVPYIKPSFPFGNLEGFKRTTTLFSELTGQFYNELKGKGSFGGIFFFHLPIGLVTDLDLVKDVLIKDFNHFEDRGLYINEKVDPLGAHLFSLDAEKWKRLRNKLSPTFTSGKMKFMYPTVIKVADIFHQHLNEIISDNEDVQIQELLARFTTDIIGTCAFGIECNSINDPEAEFRRMGKRAFQEPRFAIIKAMLIFTGHKLARFFNVTQTHSDVTKFFMGIVKETVSYREKNHIQRNDFMDLLIKLKNEDDTMSRLTIEEIAAQAFIFFLAGFETSSTTMTYFLYEMALNPDIQTKVRNEIEKVLAKHNGEFSYSIMMEMEYLEQAINETLRKYPPVGTLLRRVTKEYKVPGTNHILPVNSQMWIPVHGISRDPQYFPNPDQFDPDRFTPDEIQKRHPMATLPFGDGPRNCVGLRFGLMQSRVGLVYLLRNFEFKPCSKTHIPMKYDCTKFILTPLNGVKCSKIEEELICLLFS